MDPVPAAPAVASAELHLHVVPALAGPGLEPHTAPALVHSRHEPCTASTPGGLEHAPYAAQSWKSQSRCWILLLLQGNLTLSLLYCFKFLQLLENQMLLDVFLIYK